MAAKLGKEIILDTGKETGVLAKVTGSIKEAGVNIIAWCAWEESAKGSFRIVTDNNGKAVEALQKSGLKPQQQEIILATLGNKVGTLAEKGQKLAGAGININYCYASVQGNEALMIISTSDNTQALGILNS